MKSLRVATARRPGRPILAVVLAVIGHLGPAHASGRADETQPGQARLHDPATSPDGR